MLSLTHVGAFLALSAVVLVIPGPSVLFVVGRALAHGRRVALLTVVGNEIGAFVLAVAVALGVGAAVQRSQLAFDTIRLGGAAYIVWLGIQGWRHRRDVVLREPGDTEGPVRRPLREGFLVGIGNPKAAVFLSAVLPQFVDTGAGHVTLQLLLLGTIYVLFALLTDSLWGLAASGLRTWLGRSPRRLAAVGGAGGLAMVGVGIGLALDGRRS